MDIGQSAVAPVMAEWLTPCSASYLYIANRAMATC